MNYKIAPFECRSKSIDPIRVHLLVKLGDIVACTTIVSGFLLLSYAFYPTMFN